MVQGQVVDTKKKNTEDNIFPGVIALAIARLATNMTWRFPYPFLPEIARQLGASLPTVQTIVSLRAATGLASPLFSGLSNRYGYKSTAFIGLGLGLLATLFGILFPHLWMFALVIFISGFGKAIYDPTMQAYIGEYVPYHLRARAIGTTELAWAGSLIIIAPIAGYLLEAVGIRSVFFVLTIFNAIAIMIIWKFLPPDLRELDNELSLRKIIPQFEEMNREIIGALLFSFFLVFANELFFINYGIWMEESFGLMLTALGTVTIVIAVAEIMGEFGVIALADRIGKAKATFIGTVGSGIGYIILPYLESSLPLALFAIFIIFIFVEIAIVASISLFTEIAPRSRSSMMSTNISSHSLGRVLGGTLGGVIYSQFGDFTIIAWLATITAGIASLLLWFVVWGENH